MEHLGDFDPPPTKEEEDAVEEAAMEEETAVLNEAVAAVGAGVGEEPVVAPPQPHNEDEMAVNTAPIAAAASGTEAYPETAANEGLPAVATSPAANSSKKPRVRKHNYTHVNGVNLRSCICKRPECQKEMRRWAYTGEVNHHKAGYFILPRFKDHDALNAQYTNRFLENCVMHLFPEVIQGNREQARLFAKEHLCILQGKGPGAHHIANRHFHPRVLDHNKLWYGNKKLPIQDKFYIPAWLGERLSLHPEEDRCVVYNTDSYFALPTYTGQEFLRDLEQQEYQNHVVHGQSLLIKEMKDKLNTLRLQRPATRPAQQQAAKIEALAQQNRRLKELCREAGIDYREALALDSEEGEEDGDKKVVVRKKAPTRKRTSSSSAAAAAKTNAAKNNNNKKAKKDSSPEMSAGAMDAATTEEAFDPSHVSASKGVIVDASQTASEDKEFLGKLIRIVEDHECAAEISPEAHCWTNALKAAYEARDQPAPAIIDTSEVMRFQDQIKSLWTTMEHEFHQQQQQEGDVGAGPTEEQYHMAARQWKLFQEAQKQQTQPSTWEDHETGPRAATAAELEPAPLVMDATTAKGVPGEPDAAMQADHVAPLPAEDLGGLKGAEEEDDEQKPKAMAL